MTTDAAETAHDNLSTARSTVNVCRTDVGTKKAARDTALKALRKQARGLVTELKQLLPGNDPRWNAFGLNRPDAVGLPDVPEGLQVVGGAAGHLFATWKSARLGNRYRVFKKVVGVDSDFVLVKTTTETETDLNTFTPGQVARVRVAAANDAGDSVPCPPVELTVP